MSTELYMCIDPSRVGGRSLTFNACRAAGRSLIQN